MFWWILIGIISISLIIYYFFLAKEDDDALALGIAGIGLIILLLIMGVVTSISIETYYPIEKMKIEKTEEIELLPFSISTPDEVSYVSIGQDETKKYYWYNEKDIKSFSGQNFTSIGIGSDVNFYETNETPYMIKTSLIAEDTNFFAMWTPRHTKYDFYIPKNSIKYGITITEE